MAKLLEACFLVSCICRPGMTVWMEELWLDSFTACLALSCLGCSFRRSGHSDLLSCLEVALFSSSCPTSTMLLLLLGFMASSVVGCAVRGRSPLTPSFSTNCPPLHCLWIVWLHLALKLGEVVCQRGAGLVVPS